MVGRILAVGLVCVGIGASELAYAAPPTANTTTAPAKAYAFDVVSIRRNVSEEPGNFGKPTADGYRMSNTSFYLLINTAYVPQVPGSAFYSPGQIKGLPDWVKSENYDIDARISDEDRAAWRSPDLQKVMLRSMLQTMLMERCKMTVHREIRSANVYFLLIGKGGIKFKETDTAVEPPGGVKLPWGGVMVPGRDDNGTYMKMYGFSMASLASFLSNILSGMGDHEGIVQDKTGLTGRYDIVVRFPPIEPHAQGQEQRTDAPDDPSLRAFTLAKTLGLKLESGKGQVETLVIDRMERPSDN